MSSSKYTLDDHERRLFGRQALLVEIGHGGQRKLCDTRLAPMGDSQTRADRVALEYLTRAGCQVATAREEASVDAPTLSLPSEAEVARIAGAVPLVEAASALLGAFTAVEAIKEITGAGDPSRFPQDFVLTNEESD